MKYTKKQRNEIYRKALELFYERKEWIVPKPFLCILFEAVTDILNDSEKLKALDEFALFQPHPLAYAWWPDDDGTDFDYDSRENALLFMLEMTK